MTKARHVPQRSCVVCREVRPKPELNRLVIGPDGKLAHDASGKAPGRGAVGRPGGAAGIPAVRHRLALGLHHPGAANGTARRHLEGLLAPGAEADHRGHHLGDNIPRPLDDNGIAGTNIFAPDVLLVVQGRSPQSDPADGHRLQDREGIQRARSSHTDADVQKLRRRLSGRELVGHGPAWLAPHNPQSRLKIGAVDLLHQLENLDRFLAC